MKISSIALLIVLVTTAVAQTARTPRAGALRVITGQKDSVIYINNVRHATTGENGIADMPRVWAGSYSIRVQTPSFVDYRGRVVIAAGAKRELKITQRPTNDEALLAFQRGDQLRDRGRNAEAVAEYRKAIELRPNFPQARIAMARSLITLQEFDGAEKQLMAVLATRPLNPEAQTVLANLRRQQGLVDEAIEEYNKALRLTRGVSPEANVGLAIALEEQGEYDEAIRYYRRGISQDMDTEPILYYLLGALCEKARRYRDAIDAYRTYLRLDPQGQYASAVESMIEQLKEQAASEQE